MKRLLTIVIILIFTPKTYISAQSGDVKYKVEDTSATYKPVGKKYFNPGDSITVSKNTKFYLHYSGNLERQLITSFEGTYEISELFDKAKKTMEKNIAQSIGGKNYTPAAATRLSTDKSSNDSILVIVNTLKEFLKNIDNPITNGGEITAEKDGENITVYNKSGREMFIDVIWVKQGRCFSALSYAMDYVSYYPLSKDDSINIKIDRFANAENLFVVATSVPVAYNTIVLSDYENVDNKSLSSIKISIKHVK